MVWFSDYEIDVKIYMWGCWWSRWMKMEMEVLVLVCDWFSCKKLVIKKGTSNEDFSCWLWFVVVMVVVLDSVTLGGGFGLVIGSDEENEWIVMEWLKIILLLFLVMA